MPVSCWQRKLSRYTRHAWRNTAVINVLDGCALSLPCQAPGALPVGLMVMVEHAQDERLHAIGVAIERTLRAAGLGQL